MSEQNTTYDFDTISKALHEPVPQNLIQQREGWRDRNGNVKMVDYIEWHVAADRLDAACPDWESSISNIQQIGDVLAVTVSLTVAGITRDGVGTGNALSEMGIKKAEHDALKRAAVKFGVGRDLYKKEAAYDEHSQSTDNYRNASQGRQDNNAPPNNTNIAPNNTNAPAPQNGQANVAVNLSDLVSAKQLGMIRAISREVGIKEDEECQFAMNCKCNELSKRAASTFIKHLQGLQSQSPSTSMRRS